MKIMKHRRRVGESSGILPKMFRSKVVLKDSKGMLWANVLPQCQRHDVSQCSLLCCLMHYLRGLPLMEPVQYCMTVVMNEHVLSSGCCSQRGLRRNPLASNPKPASFAPRYVIVLILQKLTKSGQRSLHEVVCHILSDSIVKIPKAPWSLL